MKKHLVLGALAVLALAACTKSEVVEINKGNEISLTAVTGKNLTKAADGYCNSVKPNDFQVWASTTTDKKVYFKNETYTLSSGTYKSATAHYWPAQNLDFFAAKNHNGTVTFDPSAAAPFTFTGYTVNPTVSAQTDFIYAVNKDQAKGSGTATLNFRHALSQIEFKAKNSNSSIRVFIDGIKVANVKSKGNFEVTEETEGTFVDSDPAHVDTDNRSPESRGEWKNQELNATYSVTLTSEKEVASGSTVDLTYSSGEYNPNSMYLLPQTLDVWTGGVAAEDPTQDKAYFVVNALIYNVADPSVPFVKTDNVVLWGKESSPGAGDWSTKPIAVKIPTGQEWEDGKRYVYTFNFTTYGTGGTDPGTGTPVLTPIELTVTVDDFVDVAEKEVDVQ